MTTTTKQNHALTNCKGQLETIVELYKLRDTDDPERNIEEEAQDMALDVCWKSDDWQAVMCKERWVLSVKGFTPTKGRVLLTTGGPACQVICDLELGYPTNVDIQYQDWGTPWTTLSLYKDGVLLELEEEALNWFINLFYWGE